MSSNPEYGNQYSIQGYNLVTLLKRLEAATSRLEDVTIFQEEASAKNELASPTPVGDVIDSERSVGGASAAVEETPVVELPEAVKSFDDFIDTALKPFIELSQQIDPIVADASEAFLEAFLQERKFLLAVSKSKKVAITDPVFFNALKPTNEQIEKIISIKDGNRQSKFFSHLNSLAEGSPVLGWVVVDTPVSYIPEYKDAAQFWTNRIRKEFKETDPKQIEWVTLFLSIFDKLKDYVKEFHTTGPSWNNQGGSLEEALSEAAAPAAPPVAPAAPAAPPAPPTAPAAGGPPPPPPPPPAGIFDTEAKPEGGMNAVFDALNQGENITKGLKKVDRSQMTHKNPDLRASSTVSAATKKQSPVPPKKPTNLTQKPAKKPARKELVDTKWVIENFEDAHDIVIEGEMHQSVFVANCTNVTIQIKNKINALSLNECSKIGLVVDSLVSGIDVIKNTKFGIQVLATTPMISIDQSDGGQIYLAKTSMNTDIFTSSTTALNVNVPDDEQDGDFKEIPVPEQFKHSFDASGKMTSSIVEHAG